MSCWHTPAANTFTPAGTFSQIVGDYYQTCGLRKDRSITCWDEGSTTLEQSSAFTRVDTNQRVCGLTAAGAATCFPAYKTPVPNGPFVQLFPDVNSGFCGLRPTGELACATNSFFFVSNAPLAGLVQANIHQNYACGLRPDGRAVFWDANNGVLALLQDEVFSEVAADTAFCCGLTADGRAWCSQNSFALPAE